MFEQWTAPTERNRLRVAILVWAAAAASTIWALLATTVSVPGILATIFTWTSALAAAVTGWVWLRTFSDNWSSGFAITTLVAASTAFFSVTLGEFPPVTPVLVFVSIGWSIAARIERRRVAAWREEHQKTHDRSAKFDQTALRDDPLVGRRELTRVAEDTEDYAPTKRELRRRIRQAEGDPWAEKPNDETEN